MVEKQKCSNQCLTLFLYVVVLYVRSESKLLARGRWVPIYSRPVKKTISDFVFGLCFVLSFYGILKIKSKKHYNKYIKLHAFFFFFFHQITCLQYAIPFKFIGLPFCKWLFVFVHKQVNPFLVYVQPFKTNDKHKLVALFFSVMCVMYLYYCGH